MLLVGLTGGIGSGKSEVARRLAALGAVVVDADALAHAALAPGTPGLAAVAAEFGPAVVVDGVLDRAVLAGQVFADPAARARLESIVHPLVAAETERRVRAAAAADPDAVVVVDVPLLVEAGLADRYDVVVVVAAPEPVRRDRLVRLRGMDPADAAARIAAQAGEAERAAVADLVVDNAGSLADLDGAVRRLWPRLADRRPRSGRSRGPANRRPGAVP